MTGAAVGSKAVERLRHADPPREGLPAGNLGGGRVARARTSAGRGEGDGEEVS